MKEQFVERLMRAIAAYADTLKASSREARFIRSHRRELSRAVIAEIEKDHVIMLRAEMLQIRGVVDSVVSLFDELPPNPKL